MTCTATGFPLHHIVPPFLLPPVNVACTTGVTQEAMHTNDTFNAIFLFYVYFAINIQMYSNLCHFL